MPSSFPLPDIRSSALHQSLITILSSKHLQSSLNGIIVRISWVFTRNKFEKLLGNPKLQSLYHHLFEGPSKVPPWKIVTIVQVYYKVKERFYVVSAGFIVSSAGIQGGEHKVA